LFFAASASSSSLTHNPLNINIPFTSFQILSHLFSPASSSGRGSSVLFCSHLFVFCVALCEMPLLNQTPPNQTCSSRFKPNPATSEGPIPVEFKAKQGNSKQFKDHSLRLSRLCGSTTSARPGFRANCR
jgi:hypothetical protein